MKYYLYISDAKADMLLPQIPHNAKRKVATELGFDLKILEASRRSEEEANENRISRLETVVEHIRKYGVVGDIDRPEFHERKGTGIGATFVGFRGGRQRIDDKYHESDPAEP